MSHEKKKILIYRIALSVLSLLSIIITIIIACSQPKEIKIINDNAYLSDYYVTLDESVCEVEITFNTKIDSCYITAVFYDADGRVLDTLEEFCYGPGNTMLATFYVNGEVDSYEIIDYEATANNDGAYIATIIFVFVDIFFIVFLICSFLTSCKYYEFADNKIVVYAGWYYHYIKVNGIKTDEHNTLLWLTPIVLSCTLNDGTELKAVISLTNQISLKLNNLLYNAL